MSPRTGWKPEWERQEGPTGNGGGPGSRADKQLPTSRFRHPKVPQTAQSFQTQCGASGDGSVQQQPPECRGACKDVLETFSLRGGNRGQEMVNSEIHKEGKEKSASRCCGSLDYLFCLFRVSLCLQSDDENWALLRAIKGRCAVTDQSSVTPSSAACGICAALTCSA